MRRRLFSARAADPNVHSFAAVCALNVVTWTLALWTFHAAPSLLAASVAAYMFGLRHAVDADHLAAIDNACRKLARDGRRAVGAGLFFSAGHSSVVLLAVLALAIAPLQSQFAAVQAVGGVVGSLVSGCFLLTLAVVNVVSLLRTRHGDAHGLSRPGAGLLVALRPVFGMVGKSWHMFPIGFLFGLGFDTASEVGLLALSVGPASHGLPVLSVLLFPALFTAAMCLVDTVDSAVVANTCRWQGVVNPRRRRAYDLFVTVMPVLLSAGIGATELLDLLQDHFGWSGFFWRLVEKTGQHVNLAGYLVSAVFLLTWGAGAVVGRGRSTHGGS